MENALGRWAALTLNKIVPRLPQTFELNMPLTMNVICKISNKAFIRFATPG